MRMAHDEDAVGRQVFLQRREQLVERTGEVAHLHLQLGRHVRRAGFANREEPLTAPFAPVEEREAESVPQRRDRPDQV